jgi:hypothetical protein
MSTTILDAIDDPNLFARAFRDPRSWAAWRSFLAALFALPLLGQALDTFRQCTGRSEAPGQAFTEAWLVCGRRAGKSFVLALVAVYLACFHDWRPYLARGERGTLMIIAADRKQARVIMRYIIGLLHAAPMLKRMIKAERTESIDLRNSITLEIHTASFRTVRGYTIVAALLDEVAFWSTGDGANPDDEIISALKPSMATVPGAMLLAASSPYARRGALWNAFRKHHGKDGRVLVWQAPTRVMNPTVPQSVIDDALEEDGPRYSAEYLAQFRSDIESYISREVVELCVEPGVRERPPLSGLRYSGFVDPSGGSSDSMTLGIAHKENDTAILDAVREVRPPFSPQSVVEEFAQLLKTYGITKVTGDRYGGEFCREPFRNNAITYEPSAKSKSDIYRDALPALNSGRLVLLDHPKLITQLCSLERRTARGGRDLIDHAPGAHDDLANAAMGVLLQASGITRKGYTAEQMIAAVLGPDQGRSEPRLWTQQDRIRALIRSFETKGA